MKVIVIALGLAASMVGAATAREVSPPAQAIDSGYTTPVLIDDFSSNTIGRNWFAFNRDGGRLLMTGDSKWSQAFVADGKLTITTDTSGVAAGLQSINTEIAPTSAPGHPVMAGSRLFQFGYFEARMKFNLHGYRGVGHAWPAFWAGSLSRRFPHSEIDFVEAQPNRDRLAVLTSTIHEWTGRDVSRTNGKTGITPPADFDPDGFNTYGCLWTPTSVSFYINNHLSVMQGATNPTPIGKGTGFPSAGADGQVLVLGAGLDWPVEFKFVHVWQ